MRNLAIDQVLAHRRAHASSWCSAVTIALAVALAPVSAKSSQPPAAEKASQPPAAEKASQPPAAEKASQPPEAAQPAAPPDGDIAPIEIQAAPLPEPVPEPEPELLMPIEEPPPAEPIIEGPSPAQIAKIKTTRRAGIGIMATGGVVAVAGLGVTIAFTALGNTAQNAEAPVLADIEQNNSMAQVGGVLLASGIGIVAIGGIIFAVAKKKAESQTMARVNVAPTIGGMVLSGKF